jgi:hypothetical protein
MANNKDVRIFHIKKYSVGAKEYVGVERGSPH